MKKFFKLKWIHILTLLILLLIFYIFILGIKIKDIYLVFSPKQTTPISLFYYPKLSRELVQSFFIFGNEDLAYWYMTLSEKRIQEAKILINLGYQDLAKQQANLAINYQKIGNEYLSKQFNKTDVNYIINKQQQIQDNIKEVENNY